MPLPLLVLIFVATATFVWLAGVRLSDTTDVLATRLGLGEALGGLLLLAIAVMGTRLPPSVNVGGVGPSEVTRAPARRVPRSCSARPRP